MKYLMLFLTLILCQFAYAQTPYPYPYQNPDDCLFCPGPDQTDVYAIPLDEDDKEAELMLDEFNGPRSNNRDSAISK